MGLSTIITVGSIFIVLLAIVAMGMIVLAHRNKTVVELKLRETELNKQKDILANSLLIQEQERQQIGMDLHDDLGPSFFAIKLYVQQIKQGLESQNYDSLTDLLDTVADSLSDSIHKFSNISHLLYPSVLKRNGLDAALKDLVNKGQDVSNNIEIDIQNTTTIIFSDTVQLSIYRICQELINNAIKHSKASNITIIVSESIEKVHIQYVDNGVGFDVMEKYAGIGLNSLRSRAESQGGNIEMISAPGEGVKILVDMPFKV